VIIPALDEEASLPKVLAQLHDRLPHCDVVVIDDGSTDDTARVARAGGAVVLKLPYNLGIGGALRTGFRYAVREGYDRAVQFDGDGQHDPDAVQALFEALDAGADMAVGTRFADPSHPYAVGAIRRRAMWVLQALVRVLLGRNFTDTSSGFRAFDRPVLEFFARTYPVEYMESVEALLQASYAGFRVVEVPVAMYEREAGKPSTVRLKLVYHYVRLLVMVLVGAKRSRRKDDPAGAAPQPTPAPTPSTEPERHHEPASPPRPTVTSERSP
jgi:glycosyltransferase involved in cell wall biosynthesis